MTTTEENKDEKKKDIKRTKRLEARVTEKEYAKAVELAETCGLTANSGSRQVHTEQPSGAILRRHPFRGAVDACSHSPYSPLE